MKWSFSVFLSILIAGNLYAQQQWHTSPDRWSEPRVFHSPSLRDFDKRILETRLLVQRDSSAIATGERFHSPNKAYFYTVEKPDYQKPGPWNTTVYVYNEREGLQRIAIKDHSQYEIKIEWISEKLLFLRIWWGRVLGTDLILDVEAESILYREMVHDGVIPFQQYQQEKQKG